jgi:hypothetical protein
MASGERRLAGAALAEYAEHAVAGGTVEVDARQHGCDRV